MTDMDYEGSFRDKVNLIDGALRRYLIDEENPLMEIMDYSLLSGGKRFRPVLLLTAVEALGCQASLGLPAACAVEFVHAFSLVHDDMPCMDDDDFRRGRPTCHRRFGQGSALLAGDALMIKAFEILSGDRVRSPEPEKALKIVNCLARASGIAGMVGGQYQEMMAGEGPVTEEQLLSFQRCKTGALIKAALEMGGLVASAGEADMAALGSYGEALGLLFQIVDDIIDSETKEEKANFVTVIGRDEAGKRSLAYAETAFAALRGFSGSRDVLESIIDYVRNRKR